MEPYYTSRFENYSRADLKAQDWKTAERKLREDLARDPTDMALLMDLALSLLWTRKREEAADTYREVTRLYPEFAYAHGRLADVLCTIERLSDGAAAAREAIRLDPDPFEPYHILGYALYRLGYLDEAWDALQEALKRDPENGQVHFDRGMIRGLQGRWKEAVAEFRQAAALKSDPFRTNVVLTDLYLRLNEYDNARDSIDQALLLRPDDVEAVRHLGCVLKAQGDLAGAAEQYRQAIALNGYWSLLHRELGEILEEMGDRGAAIPAYEEYIRLGSFDHRAHLRLGYLFAEAGHTARARQVWETLLALDNRAVVNEARKALKKWR